MASQYLNDLSRRLYRAQVASCSCMTKTPDPSYHKPDCRYRVLVEATNAVGAATVLAEAACRAKTILWYGATDSERVIMGNVLHEILRLVERPDEEVYSEPREP